MTEAEVWDVVVAYGPLLRREVRRYMAPHRRAAEFEDMYSDAVLSRAQSIMRLYDPSRGVKPITYLLKNAKWYAFEWCMGRKYRKRVKADSIHGLDGGGDGRDPGEEDLEARWRAEVFSALERLPPDVADACRWVLFNGCTVDEVARHLGQRRAQVRETLRVGRFLLEFYHGE